jgi:hypothetical protein
MSTSASPARSKSKPKPHATPTLAPFPGVSDRALKGLATKVANTTNHFKIGDALGKLVTGWDKRYELGWYLVTTGLVDIVNHEHLLIFLGDSTPDQAAARAFARMLAHRKPVAGSDDLLAGWSSCLDDVVFAAYPVAPDAFTEAAASYPDPVKLGLAFVRRRHGETIDRAASRAIVVELAERQATGYGIASNGAAHYVADDGTLVEHRLEDAGSVKTLALRFGDEADWDVALVAAAKHNRWGLIRSVESALVLMPLAELADLFAGRDEASERIFGDDGDALTTVQRILRARSDAPTALWSAAAGLAARDLAREAVELFAATGVVRAAARGETIPATVDELFAKFDMIGWDQAADLIVAALRALPADRVLALVRRELPDNASAFGGLAAHFDTALVDSVLDSTRAMPPRLLGLLGERAVPALVRSLAIGDHDARLARYQGLLLCLARIVRSGGAVHPSLDHVLSIGRFDGKPIRFWSNVNDYFEPMGEVLAALPPARRHPILLAGLADAPRDTLPYGKLAEGDPALEEAFRAATS